MNKTIIFSLVGVGVASAVLLFIFKSNIVPLINVSDQTISAGQIIVSDATTAQAAWLVVQTETNGAPGPVIGYVKINKGENKNVRVNIDVSKSTPKLFAMIHEDSGEKNKFDFPSNDMPLIYKEEMISKLFVAQQ